MCELKPMLDFLKSARQISKPVSNGPLNIYEQEFTAHVRKCEKLEKETREINGGDRRFIFIVDFHTKHRRD